MKRIAEQQDLQWLVDDLQGDLDRIQRESAWIYQRFEEEASHVIPALLTNACHAIGEREFRRETGTWAFRKRVLSRLGGAFYWWLFWGFWVLTGLLSPVTGAWIVGAPFLIFLWNTNPNVGHSSRRIDTSLAFLFFGLSLWNPASLMLLVVPLHLSREREKKPLRHKYFDMPRSPVRVSISTFPREQPEFVWHPGLDESFIVPLLEGSLAYENFTENDSRRWKWNEGTTAKRGNLEPGDFVVTIRNHDGHIMYWLPFKGILQSRFDFNAPENTLGALAPFLEEFGEIMSEQRQAIIDVLNYAAVQYKTREDSVMIEQHIAALERRMRRNQHLASAWRGVFLPEDVMRAIIGNLQLFLDKDPAAPDGLLLSGPPGTGKTEIGRRIARAGDIHFIPTSASDLKAAEVGGTERNVKALFEQARENAPCVIFVDECEDALPDRKSTSADQFAKSITNAFLANWGGIHASERIWVIGATNHPERIDSAILRRLQRSILIPLPDAEAREGILAAQLAAMRISLDVTDTLVAASQGLSGADLATVVKSARSEASLDGRWVEIDDILRAISEIRGRDSTQVDVSATWDSLVISEDLRAELDTICQMLKNAESLEKRGIASPRGFLMAGPPGVGKTTIARTLANESGLSFYAPKPADLQGQVVGETNNLVRNVFQRARERAPVILFIDELETIAPRRGTGDQFQEQLVTAMLQEMEGVGTRSGGVFVIGATNRPDLVDGAILERLAERVDLKLPGFEERKRLIVLQLRKRPLAIDGQRLENLGDRTALVLAPHLDELARLSDGLSGRGIRNGVERAEKRAVRRAVGAGDITTAALTLSDLLEGLRNSPS